MFTRKQEKNLMLWDLLIGGLSLLGIIVFTAIFIVVENEMRLAIILELVFAVWSFAKAAKSVEDYYKKYRYQKKVEKSLKLKTA